MSKKIWLKKPATKFEAIQFTRSLLKDTPEQSVDKSRHEPRHDSVSKETAIQSTILDYLLLEQAKGRLLVQRINNTPVYDSATSRYRSMSKGQHKGFPDIFVLMGGRCIFFEVKTGRGSQSKDQQQMQEWVEQHGGEYYLVRSLEYVMGVIRGSHKDREAVAPPF